MPKLARIFLLLLSPFAVSGYDVTIASYTQEVGFGSFGHPCPFRDGSGYTVAEYLPLMGPHQIGIYNSSGTLLKTITGSGASSDFNLFGYTSPVEKGLPEVNFETNSIAMEVSNPSITPGCSNATIGQGWGFDIWILAYNPSTMTLSNATNMTNITSCGQGALHPRFTPKDDYLFFGQMYCNSSTSTPYSGCPGESSYCTTYTTACGFGVWELSTSLVTYSGGIPTPTLPATNYTLPTMTGLSAVVGWVEPCAAGGTFSSTFSGNTENGWLFFAESGDTSGQVFFNPKVAAYNPATSQFAVLVGYSGQWTEHCGITPDGTTLTYSTTLGNADWGNTLSSFSTMDMSSASIRYQNGTVNLTNNRRLTYRNVGGYPETYTTASCKTPPCQISAGKQEFFSPTTAAPNAPPVQDSLIVIPGGDFGWGQTIYAPRDHLVQGKISFRGKVTLK